MKVWLPTLLLALGWCSAAAEESKVFIIPRGYRFTWKTHLSESNDTRQYDFEASERVPFLNVEKLDDSISVKGIPLQGDTDETLHLNVHTPRENVSISLKFSIREQDLTTENCTLLPLAAIKMDDFPLSERFKALETVENLSKEYDYPLKWMKVDYRHIEKEPPCLLLMGPLECVGSLNVQHFLTIKRIVRDINDRSIGLSNLLESNTTQEFNKFLQASQDVDGGERGLGVIDSKAIYRADAVSSTSVAPATPTEPSTIAEIVAPLGQNNEAGSTEVPPERSTAPITSSEPTLKGENELTEGQEPSVNAGDQASRIAQRPAAEVAVETLREETSALEPKTTTEVPIPVVEFPSVDDDEDARRADEKFPETLTTADSGSSIALPLFTVIVLLALASAIAVFTIARARTISRKTFVIGNSYPEEINDIVVLDREDRP